MYVEDALVGRYKVAGPVCSSFVDDISNTSPNIKDVKKWGDLEGTVLENLEGKVNIPHLLIYIGDR